MRKHECDKGFHSVVPGQKQRQLINALTPLRADKLHCWGALFHCQPTLLENIMVLAIN